MFKKLLPVAMLVLGASQAWATTTYASYGAMMSANPEIVFTEVSLSTLLSLDPDSSYSFGGVTFTGSLSPGTLGGDPAIKATTGGTITIQLPAEAVAFGAQFGYYGSPIFGVTVGGGGLETTYNIESSPIYMGFVNPTPFTSITFGAQLGGVLLNSISFGVPKVGDLPPPTGDAPEPASMALMGGALAGLGLMVQRRKRRAGRPEVSEQ